MRLIAHAKINWALEITGTDGRGYHLLDMLTQSIDLGDTLTLTASDDLTLSVSGNNAVPADERNLAFRAAAALRHYTGIRAGAAIRLHKNVPSGAGLGGGSADAAAVLAGLNQLWQTGLSQHDLESIGLQLGADVPFCLRGGLCRVQGIGERLTQYPAAPSWPLVLVKPCEGLSTAEIYHHYAADSAVTPAHDRVLKAALANDPRLLPRHPGNALERVSASFLPEIQQCREALLAAGAVCAQMSGSGSAVFGVFPDADSAARAAASLSGSWPWVACCRTSASPYEFVREEEPAL